MREVSRLECLTLCVLTLTVSTAWSGLHDIRPRPQQMGILSAAPLAVNGAFYLVIPDDPTPVEALLRDEAVAQLTAVTDFPPVVLSVSNWTGEGSALMLGMPERFPQLIDSLTASGITGLGTLAHEEEYHLLVGTQNIFLAGKDHLGIEWGLMSLTELVSVILGNIYVDRAYIRDWPDFPKRICTINSSVRNQEQYDYADSLANWSYHCKMDEIEWNDPDGGFPSRPQFQLNSAFALREKFARRGQFLTFSVDKTAYRVTEDSWQEGVPITSMSMTVTSSGFVASSYGVAPSNAGFESWSGNIPNSWTMYPASSYASISRDNVNRHSGSASLKWANLNAGYEYDQTVHHRMRFGANRLFKIKFWVKTSGFSGRVLMRILGDEPVNNHYENSRLSPAGTANWTQFEVTFSSCNADTASIWIGPDYGAAGTLWIDDITLEPAGFMNMVRRPDTPLRVFKQPGNILMTEGVDYTVSEQSSTTEENYVYLPLLRRTTNGGLPLNTTVTVSWYTALFYQGGRETVCFSLLQPLEYFQTQIRALDSTLRPDGFKIHINEVTLAGYDPVCTARGLTPGQLCGSFCDEMYNIIQATRPGAPVRIYGDPFDIFVQDPRCHPVPTPPWTQGALQELNPEIEIMAMSDYSTNLDSSFNYFNQNGHSAVMAAYGNTSWSLAVNGAIAARHWPNCTGFEFYDWDLAQYWKLRDFSAMGWNFGPFFIHTPVEYTTPPDTVFLSLEIWSDSFLVSQPTQITSRSLTYRFSTQPAWTTITPSVTGPRLYGAALVVPPDATGIEYYFTATDHRSQTRKLPPDAPTRFFAALFPPTEPGGGWNPRRLDRAIRVRISGNLIEWDDVPDAYAYEIHAIEKNSDVYRRNQTLIAVQPASQPRYYLDPLLFPQVTPEQIVVIAKSQGADSVPNPAQK